MDKSCRCPLLPSCCCCFPAPCTGTPCSQGAYASTGISMRWVAVPQLLRQAEARAAKRLPQPPHPRSTTLLP